jgi:S-formylglutathione hydrolase FrmB
VDRTNARLIARAMFAQPSAGEGARSSQRVHSPSVIGCGCPHELVLSSVTGFLQLDRGVGLTAVGLRSSTTRSSTARLIARAMFAHHPRGWALAVLSASALAAGIVAAIIAAAHDEEVRHRVGRVSLINGWLPVSVQVVSVIVLLCAAGRRSPRWQHPIALVVGAGLAMGAHWYVGSAGVSGDSAPLATWIWIGLTGVAAAVAVLGWRGARWWRRGAVVLAIPLCLVSGAFSLNQWVGYLPTVYGAWSQLTAGPLPDQADPATVAALQQRHVAPAGGVVVPVAIPADASKFKHRGELVYLPPAWFASTPPPRLPVIMMIGGALNTPADWLRVGAAVSTVDGFASGHRGNAPVLVFADSGGGFNIDTECVNGSRGNAADHLTKDVVPYMISNFGVSPDRAHWGVAGFSAGGTCAVDLTVMHPDMFSAFVDIAGDLGPNMGTKTQTIDRLFGGNANAWAAFDPATVMTRHGHYTAVAGWFATVTPGDTAAGDAARTLCALGARQGIQCAVMAQPGKHDWPFAAAAFATALPWLAGQLHTPGVGPVLLPDR